MTASGSGTEAGWICLRQIAFVPNAGQARLVPTACRGVFDVGTSLARPVRQGRTIARRAIHGTRSVVGICLRQIAFVPNAGKAMLVPTGMGQGAMAVHSRAVSAPKTNQKNFFDFLKIMLAFLNEVCYYTSRKRDPGVAKFGIALEWGSRGRWFESSHSDHVECS